MAMEVMNKSSLRIEYNHGLDMFDKPIYKAKTYSNLKTTATPDGILAASQAIIGLQQHSVVNVQRNSNFEILAG